MGGFYVENPFVVFLNDGDGEPTLLDVQIPSDVGRGDDLSLFAAAVAQIAMDNGLLSPPRRWTPGRSSTTSAPMGSLS